MGERVFRARKRGKKSNEEFDLHPTSSWPKSFSSGRFHSPWPLVANPINQSRRGTAFIFPTARTLADHRFNGHWGNALLSEEEKKVNSDRNGPSAGNETWDALFYRVSFVYIWKSHSTQVVICCIEKGFLYLSWECSTG